MLTLAFTASCDPSGDGTSGDTGSMAEYVNPLYIADFPDPDVIRVGDDFYMVNSSFPYTPGLPIHHSTDLVHWRHVGNAMTRHHSDHFDVPRHGDGVYAPSIRFHDGWYYIYYGDPDFGIVMLKARHPEGPWSEPKLIAEAKGWIDPSPLWDDDGKAYLIHAFARSRAGINAILMIHEMSPDGERLLDEGRIVYDGTVDNPIIEGPKFYKRDGYYYIFSPAGSVPMGWETVLRSRDIYGPYEVRKVFAQGLSPVNGPHQGGWVSLDSGEYWFLHFQDYGTYGRILHLNPMTWTADGWPVIGVDPDGDGVGEPVMRHPYPKTAAGPRYVELGTSDEFDGETLSPQWRWQANHRDDWYSLTDRPGYLRLHALPHRSTPGAAGASTDPGAATAAIDSELNIVTLPSVLTQRFPDEEFTFTYRIDIGGLAPGEMTGIGVMGDNYGKLNLTRTENGAAAEFITRYQARGSGIRQVLTRRDVGSQIVHLRVSVRKGGLCDLSLSEDGTTFHLMANGFKASTLRWVGASIGVYAATGASEAGGHVDIDWMRADYMPQNP